MAGIPNTETTILQNKYEYLNKKKSLNNFFNYSCKQQHKFYTVKGFNMNGILSLSTKFIAVFMKYQ